MDSLTKKQKLEVISNQSLTSDEEDTSARKNVTLKELLSPSFARSGRQMSQNIESSVLEKEDEEVVDSGEEGDEGGHSSQVILSASIPKLQFLNGKLVLNSGTTPVSLSHSRGKKDRKKSKTWSQQDTEFFYQCLQKCGTDFSMIQKVYENNGGRSRVEIKNKFKREQKMNGQKIAEILKNPKMLDMNEYKKITGTHLEQNNEGEYEEDEDDESIE